MVNQGAKILLLAVSSLTFVVALIETIFAGLTRHQYYKHRRSNIFRDGNSGDSDDTSFSSPDGAFYYAPDGYDGESSGVTFELSSAELASGILSMVATLLVLDCTITLLRSQIKLNLLAYASAFLAIITVIVLSIFAWVFAQTNKDPDYYPGDGINTEKTLTWEGYVCQSEPFLVDYEGGQWWKKTCSLNVSACFDRMVRYTLTHVTERFKVDTPSVVPALGWRDGIGHLC